MQDKINRFRHLLAEQGYRVTPQRIAIYEALLASKRHPSAEELYHIVRETYPMISPATVYNTLQLLVRLGLASETGFPGETRYDGNPEAHVNILCVSCRRIFDVAEELAAEVFRRVQEKSGFELHGQRHEFFGTCPACRDAAAQPAHA